MKTIIVPIDKDAEKRLGSDKNIESDPILPTLKSLTEAAIRFDTGVYFFF